MVSNHTGSGAPGDRKPMKTASATVSIICAVAAAGLAIGVAVERQARLTQDEDNQTLRRQLSQLDALAAKNQRLANLAAAPQAAPARPTELQEAAEERAKELVRLRSEVEALRQQTREIDTLRADTRQVSATQEKGLTTSGGGQAAISSGATTVHGSPFEIVRAEYWTEKTNMDVAAELRERVRSDGLKAVASNHIKGDPDFGQPKHLTVVYRFGGVTRTNEFREGDVVILPGE